MKYVFEAYDFQKKINLSKIEPKPVTDGREQEIILFIFCSKVLKYKQHVCYISNIGIFCNKMI